ncbi:hypothetical protein HKX48_004418 [Thoreauomyces humboldtii]|nr:hypothetical protein HKX48_004418 [Thoreauomyces humboldtii]
MLVSYLPQIIKFIQKKTSEGLSLYFFFLGSIGMTSTVANMTLLQFPSIVCCAKNNQWGPRLCLENTFGLIQVSVQTFCFMTCVVLFYVYYPVSFKRDVTKPDESTVAWTRARRIAAFIVAYTSLLAIVTLVMLAFTTDSNGYSRPGTYLAGGLGVLATFTSILQFLPQILHTWSEKSVGALSIPMMMMQTPGSLLVVYSLYIQPGANWTSWLPYLICGLLQGCLLTMSVVFTLRKPSSDEEGGTSDPLLGSTQESPVVVEDEPVGQQYGSI